MPIQNINKIVQSSFFGIENSANFRQFGLDNLKWLKMAMKEKLKIIELGFVDIDSTKDLGLEHSYVLENLKQFKEHHNFATLTLEGELFKHGENSSDATHTIGLIINQNRNQHIFNYGAAKPIILIDSLGEETKELKNIHNRIIKELINKVFPDSEIITNKEPQQIDKSLSCLNWTFANLETANEYFGRTDILSKLPKSNDFESILKKQEAMSRLYCQTYGDFKANYTQNQFRKNL